MLNCKKCLTSIFTISVTLQSIGDLQVRIGFLVGEAEHDCVDLGDIGMFNELGTAHISSRPFMRDTVDNH